MLERKKYEDYCNIPLEDLPSRNLSLKDALELTDPDEINMQMLIRKKLIDQMVGSLYPGIVFNEILELREHYNKFADDYGYWG